jgi:F-type H+-transporting ATPase subunit b
MGLPDYTLFIQMINLLILLYVLNLILFRPIRKVIKERNQVVDTFNGDIATLSDRAQEAATQFERKIQEARKEGVARVQSMKDEGEEEETELIAATTQEVQTKIAEARNRVASDIQEARTQLQTQVQAFSVAVTEKILGRSIK